MSCPVSITSSGNNFSKSAVCNQSKEEHVWKRIFKNNQEAFELNMKCPINEHDTH